MLVLLRLADWRHCKLAVKFTLQFPVQMTDENKGTVTESTS